MKESYKEMARYQLRLEWAVLILFCVAIFFAQTTYDLYQIIRHQNTQEQPSTSNAAAETK